LFGSSTGFNRSWHSSTACCGSATSRQRLSYAVLAFRDPRSAQQSLASIGSLAGRCSILGRGQQREVASSRAAATKVRSADTETPEMALSARNAPNFSGPSKSQNWIVPLLLEIAAVRLSKHANEATLEQETF